LDLDLGSLNLLLWAAGREPRQGDAADLLKGYVPSAVEIQRRLG
jgi:hypothetical protein